MPFLYVKREREGVTKYREMFFAVQPLGHGCIVLANSCQFQVVSGPILQSVGEQDCSDEVVVVALQGLAPSGNSSANMMSMSMSMSMSNEHLSLAISPGQAGTHVKLDHDVYLIHDALPHPLIDLFEVRVGRANLLKLSEGLKAIVDDDS